MRIVIQKKKSREKLFHLKVSGNIYGDGRPWRTYIDQIDLLKKGDIKRIKVETG